MSARHMRLTRSGSVIVLVDLQMLVDDIVDIALQLGAEERRQLGGSVQAVAPTKCRLLGQLGERHEPLGPSGVAEAATSGRQRQAIDDTVGRAMDEGRELR